jgi:hypothetical protein
MINDGINNVPDKTIAVFFDNLESGFDKKYFNEIIQPATKKRDWFTPHFYRCLPLTVANQYGFMVTSQFDIEFEWNGGTEPSDTEFFFSDEELEYANKRYPSVQTWFGHGIITLNMPFTFRTPPGVNLLTINPPNYFLPNITVMSGSIETDNMRREFTFNFKIQIPNIRIRIPAGTPLAGFIPIPRYFADEFKIVDAEDIFSDELCIEEYQAKSDADIKRHTIEYKSRPAVGRDYFRGMDVYGNKFKDHQKP